MGNRDEFSPKTKRKVAERAAFICSNPSCNQVTIGPSESDQQKSAKVGIAAHICAASSRGPRYDMSQTLGQRKGIKNAIWLCPSCAMLVDKNGGDDYPADHLRKWKRDHETLIKKCLEGDKRIAVKLRGDTTPATKQNAKRIMDLLKHRGALFKGYSQEDPSHVIASLDKLRGKLTEIRRDLAPESQLDIVAGSIVDGPFVVFEQKWALWNEAASSRTGLHLAKWPEAPSPRRLALDVEVVAPVAVDVLEARRREVPQEFVLGGIARLFDLTDGGLHI